MLKIDTLENELAHHIIYYSNGNKQYESWWLKNKPLCAHKNDAPAHIEYDKNGKIEGEFYYQYGKLHRENGSAYITYKKDGSVKVARYYLNGNKVRKSVVDKLILIKKLSGVE